MSDRYVIEALLRPAVEFNTAIVTACASYLCITAPWAVALSPSVSYVTASGFAILSIRRVIQGSRILRYRRNIRRLKRYAMSSKNIPISHHQLFLGKGFLWEQKHTQRLLDTLRPEVAKYIRPPSCIVWYVNLNNAMSIIFLHYVHYYHLIRYLILFAHYHPWAETLLYMGLS